MLQKLELFKQSHEWQKENGEFIPYPATWLNGKLWEDEITPNTPWANSEHERVWQSERKKKPDKNCSKCKGEGYIQPDDWNAGAVRMCDCWSYDNSA